MASNEFATRAAIDEVCGKGLTVEDAERLRARLTQFYREPVQPVSIYCKSLREWQTALGERAYSLKLELFPGIDGHYKEPAAEAAFAAYTAAKGAPLKEQTTKVRELVSYEATAEDVNYIFTMISKSSMLARLIYGGEKLRKNKCPIHKGIWSGLPSDVRDCECELTGWLPAVPDVG